MTTARTSLASRLTRPAAVLFVGAGVVLTPAVAQASTTAPSAAVAAAPAPAPNHAAQVAVDTALAQVGDPYVWGAAGPNAFDCSGLTQYAYKAAGVSLPHSSSAQSTIGTAVSKADLKPGDLVFFYSPISHVGMYIGNGQIVNAPTAGDVVKIVGINSAGRPVALRRVVG